MSDNRRFKLDILEDLVGQRGPDYFYGVTEAQEVYLTEILEKQHTHHLLLNEIQAYHTTEACPWCGRELPDIAEDWECSCGRHFQPHAPADDWIQEEQERERMCPTPSPWERELDAPTQAPRPLTSLPAGVRFRPYVCRLDSPADDILGWTNWELYLFSLATRRS